MALWRFGRGWSESDLRRHLDALRGRDVNFTTPLEEMTPEHGWIIDGCHDVPIGMEAPGPPVENGHFERARQALINYDFSDPSIVVGHFDPEVPFVGRDMLLEMKVLGFHFLNGCRVESVRDEVHHDRTIFGFRYDTLQGHIERGFEWFLLKKDHETGRLTFTIEAHWRLGDFPNWWTRTGFFVMGNTMRSIWRRRAPRRLAKLAHQPVETEVAPQGQLAHRGDDQPRRMESSE